MESDAFRNLPFLPSVSQKEACQFSTSCVRSLVSFRKAEALTPPGIPPPIPPPGGPFSSGASTIAHSAVKSNEATPLASVRLVLTTLKGLFVCERMSALEHARTQKTKEKRREEEGRRKKESKRKKKNVLDDTSSNEIDITTFPRVITPVELFRRSVLFEEGTNDDGTFFSGVFGNGTDRLLDRCTD